MAAAAPNDKADALKNEGNSLFQAGMFRRFPSSSVVFRLCPSFSVLLPSFSIVFRPFHHASICAFPTVLGRVFSRSRSPWSGTILGIQESFRTASASRPRSPNAFPRRLKLHNFASFCLLRCWPFVGGHLCLPETRQNMHEECVRGGSK